MSGLTSGEGNRVRSCRIPRPSSMLPGLPELVARTRTPNVTVQRRHGENRAGEPAGKACHLAEQRRGQRLDLAPEAR